MKTELGMDRYICAVGFKDHTWGHYSQNASTDIEAKGLLRSHFNDRIKNGNGLNEDSATVEFIQVLRVEKADLDGVEYYGIDPEDQDDLEDDVHDGK